MSDPDEKSLLSYATPIDLRSDAVIVRNHRGCALPIAVSGLFLVAVATVIFYSAAHPKDLGWLTLILGGALVGVGLGQWADRSARLILGSDALFSMMGNNIEISWTDIAQAKVVHHDQAIYLILRLTDPAAASQPPTLWNRPTFDRPPEALDSDILLPISGLDLAPSTILAEIHKRIPPQLNRPAADVTP